MYVLEYIRKSLREAIAFSLYGQSLVYAMGPNPAAEASVLCGSDASILWLFSTPSFSTPSFLGAIQTWALAPSQPGSMQ